MKSIFMSLVFLGVFAVAPSVFALRGEVPSRLYRDRDVAEAGPEVVKWIGLVKDEPEDHTLEHSHKLSFVKKDDGKSYDIIDSPDLVKLHHETEKNFEVEIEAEKTAKFLFWGGNLIVKSFKVIEEKELVPHLATPKRAPRAREQGLGKSSH